MYLNSQIGQSFYEEVISAKEQIQKVKEDFSVYNGGSTDSVVFEFNGVYVLVQADTDENWLWDQYEACCHLDVKSVGFFDVFATVVNAESRIAESVKESKQRRENLKKEHDTKVAKAQEVGKLALEKNPSAYQIWASEKAEYLNWALQNTDDYGNAIFEMAEVIMSVAVMFANEKKLPIIKVFGEACDVGDAYIGGGSGFMMSAALQIIKRYWVYRELVKDVR
jgi:hypothetical protein